MNDFIAFLQEHKPLTAAYALVNVFALLILTGRGFTRTLVFGTAFTLAYIWFLALAAISLLNSHERSKQ